MIYIKINFLLTLYKNCVTIYPIKTERKVFMPQTIVRILIDSDFIFTLVNPLYKGLKHVLSSLCYLCKMLLSAPIPRVFQSYPH